MKEDKMVHPHTNSHQLYMVYSLEGEQCDDGQEEAKNRHTDTNDGDDTESSLHLNNKWGLHRLRTNVLNEAKYHQ